MFRYTIFTFIFLFQISTAFSQTLTGVVTDKAGTPIQDAFVLINTGKVHAHTNELGTFYFEKAKIGDTLSFSYLGFETANIILDEGYFKKSFTIALEEKSFDLNQVVLSNSVRSVSQVSNIDLKINPVNSSQEILRRVPGLFIGQHAGGGKAEQLFLRGFDIDHGTDVSISVDGMPVNMVSHAHGQGYADLHFLIPETIERLDFGKGPYYSDKGNFTTAGYVDFQTKNNIEQSSAILEVGRFNTLRTVGLFDLLSNVKNQNAYIAGEYVLTDGPVESSQNFNRINLMGKYSISMPNNDQLSFLVSHFESKWDASGQIPQRAVDAGLITRFGAIDDTEGGATGRTNFAISHTKSLNANSFVKSKAFFSRYDFELFSNFTFFLEDPENGDQIRQTENRNIFGFESFLNQSLRMDNYDFNLRLGGGFRYDAVKDNTLARTLNRKTTLEELALGNVYETNFFGYANTEFDFDKFIINPGLRLDYFKFDYNNQLVTQYQTLSENKLFLSPKLNFLYNPNFNWQFFLKTGIGFHSNDTRVVVARGGEEILPAAYGIDLGTVWKPLPRIWMTGALWALFLEQEFVYVGDAGIVEPSGKTRRTGVEFGLRYQATDWLFFDSDINYTYARSTEEPEGADYIPLAPDLTAAGGFSLKTKNGISGGLRYRYIKDRPANEDDTITAEGYFILDMNLNYQFNDVTFGFAIENLLDTEWNEAQFATESRLRDEAEPVEELHFTPGMPFFVKGRVTYNF
jgi:outer membrane receptor for ferrienterochelin and colicin